MNHFKQIFLGSLICVSLLAFAPRTRAGEWNEEIHATFNGPVQVPGHVLPPGTYGFKLLDSETASRNVVEVTNADQSRVVALALSIPRYRTGSIDNALFVLAERAPDAPQAIQAWYYPGHSDGHQFLYGSYAMPIAATANSAPAPGPTSEPAATTPNAAEESAPAVSNESNVSESAPEAAAQNNQSTDQNQIAQSQTTPDTASTDQTQNGQELPKTASSTPLVGLIGMLLVGGALGLKAIASRL